MAKTVVGLYDDSSTAEKVVRDLENHGFARENISLAARDQNRGQAYSASESHDTLAGEGAATGAGTGAVLGGLAGLLVGLGALAIPGIGPIIAAGPLATALAGAGIGAAAGGLIGALAGAGVPEEDAHAYAEGVRRGGTLVMVNSPDDRADEAADIMNRYHPVDIDTRRGNWQQQSNWSRFDETSQPYSDEEVTQERSRYQMADFGEGMDKGARTEGTFDREGETHIPIVEEQMNVDKRQVQRGGVRVHSYVTEKPVEETHHVRDETVNVERRPADRPLREGDLDAAFQDQTFDVRETDEELVKDKQAHVVEDVVVRKDVEERPETVRDTLRRTDVETENLGTEQTTRGTRDFNAFANDFRTHYDTEFGGRGRDYGYYQPGYRYGYDLANNPSYRGRKWADFEPEARREWERSHQGSAWDDFKDSIRYAWERATRGASDADTTTYGSDEGYAAGTRGRM